MTFFNISPFLIFISIVTLLIPGSTHSKALDEKNFVIVIPSYNNARWYQRNLQSALSQNYTNFRIIYADDCSPDGTGELVQEYLKHHDLDKKVCLIKNKMRRGALHNLYTMIYMSNDDDIIVTLDGDDWLADNNVLTRLNNVYSSGEVWLTYGQFQLHPSGIKGWASAMPDYIVENNAYRDFQHLPTHLRTFYSWLFKNIKLDDLLYYGTFYPMSWDMTMMIPMIEMAGERHQFIPEVMYIYNDENNISDHHVSRQLQAHLAQVIKKKKHYKRLSAKPYPITKNNNFHADAIIFAQNPTMLTQLLQSIKTYVSEIDHLFIMYKPTSDREMNAYTAIQMSYPEIKFYLINEHRSNFKETLFNIYQKTKNDYVLFAKGDAQFTQPVSLATCINVLQETDAYAFYFKLNTQDGINNYPKLSMVECRENIFAWNFALAQDKWSSANSLDLVLHKKTIFLAQTLQNHYDLTPNGLEAVWANEGNLDRLGLCFNKSYIEKIH